MSPRQVGGRLGSGGQGTGSWGCQEPPGEHRFPGTGQTPQGPQAWAGQALPPSLPPRAAPGDNAERSPRRAAMPSHCFSSWQLQGLKQAPGHRGQTSSCWRTARGRGHHTGPDSTSSMPTPLGPTTSEQRRASTGGWPCALPPTSREGRELQDTATGPKA